MSAKSSSSRRSKPKGVVSESRVRVRYAETDQMGVVYHANHFIWFEIGRVDLMRQLGFHLSRPGAGPRMFHPRGGRALPVQSAGTI